MLRCYLLSFNTLCLAYQKKRSEGTKEDPLTENLKEDSIPESLKEDPKNKDPKEDPITEDPKEVRTP